MSRIFNLIGVLTLLTGLLTSLVIGVYAFAPSMISLASLEQWKESLYIYGDSEIEGFKSVDLGTFLMDIPEDMKYYPMRGIDSYVGIIEGEEYELFFDYGWYGDDFSGYNPKTHELSIEMIHGRKAKLIMPKDTSHSMGLYFKSWSGKNTLSIYVQKWKDQETARRMLHSVRKK